MSDQVSLDKDPTPTEEAAFINDTDSVRKWLSNASFKQDIEDRHNFCERAFCLTFVWIGFLMILAACQFYWRGLTETEFNIVFTTSTASVFVFWGLVGKYLFRSSNESN